MALLRELLRRNRDRLTVRTLRIGTTELRAVRYRHSNPGLGGQSSWRRGSVLDRKKLHHLKARAVRLNADHVRRALDAVDFFGGLVDLNGNVAGSGRRHAEIVDAIASGAHQSRPLGSAGLERKLSLLVGCGLDQLGHSLHGIDQHNFDAARPACRWCRW